MRVANKTKASLLAMTLLGCGGGAPPPEETDVVFKVDCTIDVTYCNDLGATLAPSGDGQCENIQPTSAVISVCRNAKRSSPPDAQSACAAVVDAKCGECLVDENGEDLDRSCDCVVSAPGPVTEVESCTDSGDVKVTKAGDPDEDEDPEEPTTCTSKPAKFQIVHAHYERGDVFNWTSQHSSADLDNVVGIGVAGEQVWYATSSCADAADAAPLTRIHSLDANLANGQPLGGGGKGVSGSGFKTGNHHFVTNGVDKAWLVTGTSSDSVVAFNGSAFAKTAQHVPGPVVRLVPAGSGVAMWYSGGVLLPDSTAITFNTWKAANGVEGDAKSVTAFGGQTYALFSTETDSTLTQLSGTNPFKATARFAFADAAIGGLAEDQETLISHWLNATALTTYLGRFRYGTASGEWNGAWVFSSEVATSGLFVAGTTVDQRATVTRFEKGLAISETGVQQQWSVEGSIRQCAVHATNAAEDVYCLVRP